MLSRLGKINNKRLKVLNFFELYLPLFLGMHVMPCKKGNAFVSGSDR